MSDVARDDADQQPVTDWFVNAHVVPAADAESYCHIGLDDEYHPTGGYWFPSDLEYDPDQTGLVESLDDLPTGGLVQYPCDDRPPELLGKDELPEWVTDWVVDWSVPEAGPRPTEVRATLQQHFSDRVYSVEDDRVWVSGMNAHCVEIAKWMAAVLDHELEVSTGEITDDGASRFGGVEFTWRADT